MPKNNKSWKQKMSTRFKCKKWIQTQHKANSNLRSLFFKKKKKFGWVSTDANVAAYCFTKWSFNCSCVGSFGVMSSLFGGCSY